MHRPLKDVDSSLVQNMKSRDVFVAHLGDRSKYADYLRYFQAELAGRPVKDVLQEYLFAGDEFADDILSRLFDGWLLSLFFFYLFFSFWCFSYIEMDAVC